MSKRTMFGLGFIALGLIVWKSNQKKGIHSVILDRKKQTA